MTDFNPRLLSFNTLAELRTEVASIESNGPETLERLTRQAAGRLLRLQRVPAQTALILRQELLAIGGDALLSQAVYLGQRDTPGDVLICASLHQLQTLVERLQGLPRDDLQQLGDAISQLLAVELGPRGGLHTGPTTFEWGRRTYVMGIINVTPDSFSGDGLATEGDVTTADLIAGALAQARRFADEGADILDVGGESTRPGAQVVTVEEEQERVVPVVAALARSLPLPISVDSYRAEVVAAALDAGAHIVNDVWGLRAPEGGWNEPLARLVAERQVPLVLMHNRRAQASVSAIGGFYADVTYGDLLDEITSQLRAQIAYAEAMGIARERIIIDPGIGFGKTPEQNLVLMRRLGELRSLGLPLLVGASRKSFIGLTLGLPADQRDEGTAATTVLAIQAGADIVRVHNVRINVRAARMVDAILREIS